MSKQISPLPWAFDGEYHYGDNGGKFIRIKDADDEDVSGEYGGPDPEDAAFIVKAVNSHDQLVEALMVASMSAGFKYMTYETRELINAALAAVEAA